MSENVTKLSLMKRYLKVSAINIQKGLPCVLINDEVVLIHDYATLHALLFQIHQDSILSHISM